MAAATRAPAAPLYPGLPDAIFILWTAEGQRLISMWTLLLQPSQSPSQSCSLRFNVSGVRPATTKSMDSKQVVHMNHGDGETSYARNSSIQSAEQNRMKPLIEAAIVDLCSNANTLSPAKMVIADLGCSSGPNALALVSMAVEATCNHFLQLQQPPPEVCLLLNDLPDNDFNMVVKSLVALQQAHEPVCVTGIVPGSFYERLFPSGSMHLICSSNSLHWLSKAPEDLRINRIRAYDIDEHARREKLPIVTEAYARQFKKDFTLFLQLRAKELVPEGRMVVSLAGMRSDVPVTETSHAWGTVAQILGVMASEGEIDKAKFDSFYVPAYGPCAKELRATIEEEGSFSITEMQVHDPTSGMSSALLTPKRLANGLRAAFEPIIVQHFGSDGEIMDKFVKTAERHMSLQGSSQVKRTESPRVMLVVSLKKA